MTRKQPHNNYVNLDKLRGLLAEKKITYKQCAEAIGISKYQFSRKMTGIAQFWIDEVIDLCLFLKLSREEIYTIFFKEISEVV